MPRCIILRKVHLFLIWCSELYMVFHNSGTSWEITLEILSRDFFPGLILVLLSCSFSVSGLTSI